MTDSPDRAALIFDVDGTLIDSEGLDARYFVQAVKDVLGDVIEIAWDWSKYKNITDIGIVSEIINKNGLSMSRETICSVRNRFRDLLSEFFEKGGVCRPLPGANEFLSFTKKNRLYSAGIATGGWSVTAFMKMEAAGMDFKGLPLSSSDDADERTTIMLKCVEKMGGAFRRIVYFGDGVWDLDASERLGWSFIGIGEKLRGKCEVWFPDFSKPEAIVGVIEHPPRNRRCWKGV